MGKNAVKQMEKEQREARIGAKRIALEKSIEKLEKQIKFQQNVETAMGIIIVITVSILILTFL